MAGCSPAVSPDVSENSRLDIPLSELNPAGDSGDIAEGLSQAQSAELGLSASQLQASQPSSNALADSAPAPSDSPVQPEQPEPAGALEENPALKSAASGESQPGPEAITQPAQESSLSEATAPSGEPNIGFLAPEFSLQTVDGQPVSLADLRGKNVLLNYWVTWCIPCLEEMPVLEKLHQEYQDQNMVILSVNGIQQDELDTVKATLGEFAVTFPVALDQSAAVYDSYRVQFMPTSFFIDDQGVIRYIQLGSSNEEGLRSKIEQLISDQL